MHQNRGRPVRNREASEYQVVGKSRRELFDLISCNPQLFWVCSWIDHDVICRQQTQVKPKEMKRAAEHLPSACSEWWVLGKLHQWGSTYNLSA